MATYRLRKGFGAHACQDGHEINQENPVYETDENLAEKIPDKFELVSGRTESEGHAYGDIVTADFPLAETVPQCVVWKKGRRYRITVDNHLHETDPARLVNEDDVNTNLKSLSKSHKKSVKEDEESEPVEERKSKHHEEEEKDDDEEKSKKSSYFKKSHR